MDEHHDPIEVPYRDLSAEALRGVIEAFLLREGTEYGRREYSLQEKVRQVMLQLERGEVRIVFDAAAQSVEIVVAGQLP